MQKFPGVFSLIAAFFLPVVLLSHPAWGIALDQGGNVYFTDVINNGRGTLWKLTPSGELYAVLEDFHSHNVTIDQAGTIWTTSSEPLQYLVRIEPSGRIDTVFNSDDIEQFYGGNAAVSPAGNVYFCIRHQIRQWVPGESTQILSGMRLEWNQVVYVDEDENVYATDIGKGMGELWMRQQDGQVRMLADSLLRVAPGKVWDPHSEVLLGVTKDRRGAVYVCDLAGRRIVRIAPDGGHSDLFVSLDNWAPTAITFSGDTAVVKETVTTDLAGHRIRKIYPDGSSEVVFTYNGSFLEYKEPVYPARTNDFRLFGKLLLIALAGYGAFRVFIPSTSAA